MRVVQTSKAYWPHLGGIETIVRQLAEGFVARDIESAVVVAGAAPHHEIRNGVDIRRVRSIASVRSVPVAPTFPQALLRSHGDVLLVHEPSVIPELVVAFGHKRLRKRFPTIAMWYHSDIVRQRILNVAYGPTLARAMEATDIIFTATPNHLTSSPLLTRFADNVRVVPFGVDLARFARTPSIDAKVASYRQRFGPRIVLFVGRLIYYKGIGKLVAAMEDVPDAHLVVVGTGPEQEALGASALARSGRLTILPPADEENLVALMHACQIFVLPSTEVTEAFGIVQVEAMACGRPVITYDLPTGVTWVNRHNETGLVVPLGDVAATAVAITQLLDDDELRTRLGDTARRRVESEMTEALMVDRVVDALAGRATP